MSEISSVESRSLLRRLLWRLFHGLLAFESLGILDFLGFVGGHCLARADNADSAINCIRRFENTLLALTSESKVSFALLAAFLLEV